MIGGMRGSLLVQIPCSTEIRRSLCEHDTRAQCTIRTVVMLL